MTVFPLRAFHTYYPSAQKRGPPSLAVLTVPFRKKMFNSPALTFSQLLCTMVQQVY
nr:MAG TPA: hypothetical protein [Caudoviricetes sp.]